MRRVLLFLFSGVLLGAGITDVRVVAITPTQAVLAYTAPGEGRCTLKVTAGTPGGPLVNDVNPDLFDGADGDGRPGNLVSGTARVFVVGKRAAERAKNGRMSSRALEAFTRHYYEIACGNEKASGEFETTNLALGNTAPEPYPVDPDRPGEYAWPNMDFGAGPNEKHVDPQTGILINRLTGPKSYLHDSFPDLPIAGAIDTGAGPNRWQAGGS
jgi:hypothetical protein